MNRDVKKESEGNIISLARARCAQLFIIFSGRAGFMMAGGSIGGVPPIQFLRATGLGSRNVTWIRDPNNDNYLQGVGGSIDSLDALSDWLVEHIESQPQIEEVYCIGNSSGGYGALYFGHMLKANTVWAFSPRTATMETAKQAEAALLEKLADDNGVTDYRILFARENDGDREFAEIYADSPGVTLDIHDGFEGSHGLLYRLTEQDKIGDYFPPFLATANRF